VAESVLVVNVACSYPKRPLIIIQSGRPILSNKATDSYETRPAILTKQGHLLQNTINGKIGKEGGLNKIRITGLDK